MGFVSSFSGSFKGGRRASSSKFGLKKNKLIAHYDGSDSNSYSGSGTTFTDLSGNGHHGSIIGSPTFENDHFILDNDDYIRTGNLWADIGAANPQHTCEVWFYPTGDDGVIAQYQGTPTPNTSYHFSAIEIVNGSLEFGLWNNGLESTSTGPVATPGVNQWHQAVLTYDGTHMRGYLNGAKVCKSEVSWQDPESLSSIQAFYISFGENTLSNQGNGTDFLGRIGQIRVYNRKISTSGIRRNYNYGKERQSEPVTSWSPNDISLAAWIDASDSGSYTTIGSTLTSVTDKSGTYSTMSSGNGGIGGTPTTGSSLNGLNTFTFSGTNEFIQSTTFAAQTDASGNHWAIGVFRWDSTSNTKSSFWSFETNQSPKRDYAVSSSASNNTWPGELDMDGLSSNRISSTIGNALQWTGLGGLNRYQWYIVAVYFNKTGNQIGLRFDGRTNSFSPVNDYDNALSTNQELRLMRNRASVELQGKMAEFMSVAGLPGTGGTDMSEIEKAEGYLAHKWGITGSLPSSHPYKNSAP